MNKVLNVYKPISKTPLQVILELKEKFPEYKDERISYAGRLDPLAHGVMILLVGEANKDRAEYEKMDKTYSFKAIIGIETDTYDVLGLPTLDDKILSRDISEKEIESELLKFQGTFSQPLPPFSSFTIDRIPLFKWARMGKLNEIKIPEKDVTVSSMTLDSIEKISAADLLKSINQKVTSLEGDFRQEEILKRWDRILTDNSKSTFNLVSATASVTSGTYIRSIVHYLGKKLQTSATTLEIFRSKAGNFNSEESLHI